ncbi:MAG: Gfo/Idh/MocA family protein [Bacteroidota bacterium]|jgi:predicted dehydrogenase
MIRLGIFGVGRFGQIHLKQLSEIKEFELVGIYDSNEELSEQVSNEFGIKKFASAEELIEVSDALDIVSTTESHFSIAQKGIRAFKHLFIEKPVTVHLDQAKILFSMAKEAGVKIQVGHVERFNPAFLNGLRFIKSPVFIESHRLAEFKKTNKNVSVLEDIMVHDIDIMLQLVDSPIKKINATSVGILNGSPDIVNTRIEFDNGCTASLTASRLAVKNMRITRVYQKDASISMNFLENKTGIITKTEVEKDAELLFPEVTPGNAIRTQLAHFADCIKNNCEPTVNLDHAIKALSVAELIKEKLLPQSNFLEKQTIS